MKKHLNTDSNIPSGTLFLSRASSSTTERAEKEQRKSSLFYSRSVSLLSVRCLNSHSVIWLLKREAESASARPCAHRHSNCHMISLPRHADKLPRKIRLKASVVSLPFRIKCSCYNVCHRLDILRFCPSWNRRCSCVAFPESQQRIFRKWMKYFVFFAYTVVMLLWHLIFRSLNESKFSLVLFSLLWRANTVILDLQGCFQQLSFSCLQLL